MFAEKQENEYGSYLYRAVVGESSNRSIVFIHDYLADPEYHDEFCDKLQIFNYYALYVPYARVRDFGEEVPLEKVSFISLIKQVKDLILSFGNQEIFLIGEGIGATIALAVASLLTKRVQKLVLVNPFTSVASANTIQTIVNIPKNLDECFDLMKKMFFEDSRYLLQGTNSPYVVNPMRKIYYNYNDYCDFTINLVLPKTLEAIKMYENNITIPTLLVVGENDEFLSPIESILAYKKRKNIKVVQLPNTKHYPMLDKNKTFYIESILKFFINDLGLNTAERLPNKYIYKYLSDEWKKYYRTTFAEKLSEREQKEYLEKLQEYEKEIKNEIEIPQAMDESYIQDFVSHQAVAIKQVQDIVNYNREQEEQYKKTLKLSLAPDIYIDYNIPANKVVVNSQGFEVYHDGKGNGFYRDYNGNWKTIVDKSKI